MKKKAFTLTELLISLAVIGVVAALTIPAISNMMPDETKVKYMKAYNSLATVTNEILSDPALYYTTYLNGNINCSGLYCNSLPLVAPYNQNNNYTFGAKYPMLVASQMHLQGEATVTNNNSPLTTVSFTTIDGVDWVFEVADNEVLGVPGNGEYTVDIRTTLNVKGASNCTFDDNCDKPDQFTFRVSNNGNISATDKLGRAFLMNATDMHSKKEDRDKAKTLD